MRISPSLVLPRSEWSLVRSALSSFSLNFKPHYRFRQGKWRRFDPMSPPRKPGACWSMWVSSSSRMEKSGIITLGLWASLPSLISTTKHMTSLGENGYLLCQIFQVALWVYISSNKNHVVEKVFSSVTWADYRLIHKYPEGNLCLISHLLDLQKCTVLHKYQPLEVSFLKHRN